MELLLLLIIIAFQYYRIASRTDTRIVKKTDARIFKRTDARIVVEEMAGLGTSYWYESLITYPLMGPGGAEVEPHWIPRCAARKDRIYVNL